MINYGGNIRLSTGVFRQRLLFNTKTKFSKLSIFTVKFRIPFHRMAVATVKKRGGNGMPFGKKTAILFNSVTVLIFSFTICLAQSI